LLIIIDDINLDDGVLSIIVDVDTKLYDEFVDKGNKILSKFESGNPFQDDKFAGNKALSITGSEDYDVDSWKRPKEMLDSKGKKIDNPQIINNGFGVNDIGQGGLGDCWFLSAMSVVAFTRPDLLKKLFHPKSIEYSDKGIYVIRFFKGGRNRITYIDDFFPVKRDGRSVFCQVFSENGSTELWPIMLEKAFAKIHNSYEALDGGLPEQALVDLTNGISERISFDTKEFKQMKNDGTFWQKLM
jgi:hypothetical protein